MKHYSHCPVCGRPAVWDDVRGILCSAGKRCTVSKNEKLAGGVEVRNVIYHNTKGVYLGGNWSLIDHGWIKGAPTYTKEEAEEELATFDLDDVKASRLVMVFPDLPGKKASPYAVAAAALPRWDPESKS